VPVAISSGSRTRVRGLRVRYQQLTAFRGDRRIEADLWCPRPCGVDKVVGFDFRVPRLDAGGAALIILYSFAGGFLAVV
jgi:hypothetical protein